MIKILQYFLNKKTKVRYFIEKLVSDNKNIYFIQIGSHNGISNDPLYPFINKNQMSGILIEPVKELFNNLVENYKHKNNLHFENIAIHSKQGENIFYYIPTSTDNKLPEWHSQLGSFKKEVILKHSTEIPDIENLIIEKKIPCNTIENILKKYNLPKVDLIHIDTEGFDYEIVKLIPFQLIEPKLIIYEHKHLSLEDSNKCNEMLKENGYEITILTVDTVASKI